MCSVFCLSVIITIRGLGTDKSYFVWPFKGESQGGRRGQYLKDCLDCGTGIRKRGGSQKEISSGESVQSVCSILCHLVF